MYASVEATTGKDTGSVLIGPLLGYQYQVGSFLEGLWRLVEEEGWSLIFRVSGTGTGVWTFRLERAFGLFYAS